MITTDGYSTLTRNGSLSSADPLTVPLRCPRPGDRGIAGDGGHIATAVQESLLRRLGA